MFGQEHRAGPRRAPGDCQLLRYQKACRFAGRTTEHTVTRDGGHISRPDTEHASVVYTLDSYPLSIPSFKLSNARAKASSKFSRSNIVQGELRVCRRNTRSTLAVFSCSTRSRDFLRLASGGCRGSTWSTIQTLVCSFLAQLQIFECPSRSQFRVFHRTTRSRGKPSARFGYFPL